MLYRTELGERITGLLMPRRCPVCGDIVPGRGKICPPCYDKLPFQTGSTCMKCGKEINSYEMEYCRDCMKHPKPFEYGVSLLNYEGPMSDSMSAIKYGNKREYLDFYAEESVRRLGRKLLDMKADVLIPVPVHKDRLRKRGFNQAEELAERVGELLDIPVLNGVLIRTKATEALKELNPEERKKNLATAFSCEELPDWARNVILVDDIYTTGSTISACTRALQKAGAEKVYFYSICVGIGD